MPKHSPEPNNKKSKFGIFARLIRRPIDGTSLQWALGALIALVADAHARAEDAPVGSERLDDSKIQYSVLDSDGTNISINSDDAAEGEGSYRKVVIQDPGIRPDLPLSLRQLLVDIASATPIESGKLLEEIRANAVAQARATKTNPIEKQSSVTVKGADGVTESKVTTVSLDPDGEVYKAIRQAALDYENGQLGKGFALTSADLNQAIPLQFVDENDQEILWAKEDSINPWYFSPLALLGAAGGGGGAAAVAGASPIYGFSGVLLEDAVKGADVYLEITANGGKTWSLYQPTVFHAVTDVNGNFAFNNLDANTYSLLSSGTLRIHAFANGIDQFTGKSVGDFYITALPGQTLDLTKQIIVDPIATISALTGISQATLKTELFGASYANVTFDTAYLATHPQEQDAIRQIYATLRAANEIAAGQGQAQTLETLTLAAKSFAGALAQFATLNGGTPAVTADLVAGDYREGDLNSNFIASGVQFAADVAPVTLTDAEIARLIQATINSAQQVTNTHYGHNGYW